MLKPQSIRKGVLIKFNGIEMEKADIIAASESWSENHELMFKKMLKQGGEMNIKGTQITIQTKHKNLNSQGNMDGGIQKIDPLARF